MNDPLKPSPALLVKLGSMIVHLEEYCFGNSHDYDLLAIRTIREDPEYQEWIAAMNKMGMLPVKRKAGK